jgi:uncharacterized membrane protein
VGSSTASDHYTGNTSSYAVDFGVSGAQGDRFAEALADKYGIPRSNIGTYNKTVIETADGKKFEVQLLWKVKGHYDHVHLGIRAVGADAQTGSTTQVSAADSGHDHNHDNYSAANPSSTTSNPSSTTSTQGQTSSGAPIDQSPAPARANAQQYAPASNDSSTSLNTDSFYQTLIDLLSSASVADEDSEFNEWKNSLSEAEKKLPLSELKSKFLAMKLAKLAKEKIEASKASGSPISEKQALEAAKDELSKKYSVQTATSAQRDVGMPVVP